jgi:DNA polymerase III alpha subunit
MKIKILRRDINKSKLSYFIEKRKNSTNRVEYSEIRPSLLCKGIGIAAAKNIEENQPFSDLRDFVQKIDSSIVDTRVFEALLDNGYFGPKARMEKEDRQKQYIMIRSDLKKVAKQGRESTDLFGS